MDEKFEKFLVVFVTTVCILMEFLFLGVMALGVGWLYMHTFIGIVIGIFLILFGLGGFVSICFVYRFFKAT